MCLSRHLHRADAVCRTQFWPVLSGDGSMWRLTKKSPWSGGDLSKMQKSCSRKTERFDGNDMRLCVLKKMQQTRTSSLSEPDLQQPPPLHLNYRLCKDRLDGCNWLVTIQNPALLHFVKPVKPLSKKSLLSAFHTQQGVYLIKPHLATSSESKFVKRTFIIDKLFLKQVSKKVLVHLAPG